MHSITGVLQDWTQDGESWYYKTTATIVNGNKVKQENAELKKELKKEQHSNDSKENKKKEPI